MADPEAAHGGIHLMPPSAGPVASLPGYGEVKERQLAGYLPATPDGGAYIYFWFVESQGDASQDPIVLWLNGGPGSSSFLGFFAENGPYKIGTDLSLADNPWSWNKNASYLMIDQPAGTGLSVVNSPADWARTEQEATDQLLFALQHFFTSWPEYRERDFFVFGESFAGTYIPMLATAILASNAAGSPEIKLAGIGIGDGWVDPYVQQATYGDYAYAHGLVGLAEKIEVDHRYSACAKAIVESGPVASRKADKICNKIEEYITAVSGGANVYDVRSIGDYDFSYIGRYLDQPEVRTALHVDPAAPAWSDTSKRVGHLLEKGEQDSVADLYPLLFETLPVLIYNGIYDMDCNFMGTDAWIGRLHWSHRGEFLAAKRTPWLVDGVFAGHERAAGNLQQVLVAEAGHLVPMDQPANALALLDGFIARSATLRA
jgi:carboxypeptidase C (cathepsin A)